MSDLRDTLFRYLTLLQLIPRYPGRASTPVLKEKLAERGFQIDSRSLQRDLRDRLSVHFPLVCDDSQKPYRWYFDRDFHCNLPALDVPSALTLVLAEEYLKGLLPPVVIGQLSPHFTDARRLLDELSSNGLSRGARKVRAIPNGKALIPAELNADTWQVVTEALLEQKAIDVTYLSRSSETEKPLTLHPQGMVSRHSVTYLLATVNSYADIRQFALHRVRHAALSEQPWRAREDFNIDTYIQGGAFGYRQGAHDVTLSADIARSVAWLLQETPLSHEQSVEALPGSDWYRLTARVPDDQQTLWWLMGLGANVKVLAPSAWRDELKATAERVLAHYADDASAVHDDT
ncbi:helix-turn-helix transcriptional regulator [Vreelandella subglaciescola]|uniref:Predicted DNA-binding transcriptional regulator YafY, contains an HTH and WYL domains n=1 Tax=Vreelandella subglaciescola TaxID=29571 RepID=A0A1M7GBG9_9GAMM|nr:WYL domain-containing protein [Halomonas subglaciescola]SHM13287.1 Predicted DNA-binding transcriptional regulator YafY, contains an HTH and WYL domains [Halomonas subglaciescola]